MTMTDTALHVLLFEDNPQQAERMRRLLHEGDPTVVLEHEPSVSPVRERPARGDPDLILLSEAVPIDRDPVEIAEALGFPAAVPVILLTSQMDEDRATRALRSGVQDALAVTDLKSETLLRAVRGAIERHKATMALRAQEARNRSILDAIPDMIVVLDRSGRFLSFKLARDFPPAVSPDEIVGAHLSEIFPAPIAERAEEHLQRAFRSGEVQTFEYELENGEETRRFEARLVAIRKNEALALVRDITARMRVQKALHRYAERLRILRHNDKGILAAESPEAIARTALHHLKKLVPFDQGNVTVFDEEAGLVTVFATAAGNGARTRTGSLLSIDSFGDLDRLRAGQPQIVEDARAHEPDSPAIAALAENGVRSFVRVPLISKDELIGALTLESPTPGTFNREHVDITAEVADSLAIAIQQARLFEQVRQMAITDEGTGLYNRRHFFELAQRELERVRRYGGSLSAIMVDIDDFKRVNDEYGHVIGDQVLRQVARRMDEKIRETDVLARYGGDEFAILLPETDLLAAHRLAERLRHWTDSNPIPSDHGPIRISISVGVATVDEEGPDLESLLDRADQDMYASKRAG